jgi:endonuclease/exonuclease/phosphatase family metal-dependent hydrolase
MEQEQFEQLVNKSTHDRRRTIDHCYVSKELKNNTKLKQYSPYYSDHDALCITVDL